MKYQAHFILGARLRVGLNSKTLSDPIGFGPIGSLNFIKFDPRA